jgi:hypothetical protein
MKKRAAGLDPKASLALTMHSMYIFARFVP